MKIIYKLFIIILFPLSSFGQTSGIKIGEKCPDALLEMYNYKMSKANLYDFKKDILILDFWATYCGGCINAFKKFDVLQRDFKDQITILPITDENFTKVKKFWPKNNITKKLAMPTVVGDTILKKYFPHTSFPHDIWINKEGIVIAITGPEYVNRKNIEEVLKTGKIELTEQKYIAYDISVPFVMLNEPYRKNTSLIYQSSLTSYLDGIRGTPGVLNFDTVGNSVRAYTINNGIPEFCKIVVKGTNVEFSRNRFLLQTKDSVRFYSNNYTSYQREWIEKNQFCYESLVPLGTPKAEIIEQLRLDINKYFKINARMEKRRTACWVLRDLKDVKKVKNKSNLYVQDLPLILNSLKGFPPILNESTINNQTVLSPKFEDFLNSPKPDLKIINGVIQETGLILTSEIKELEFFVLTEL